MKPSQPPLQKKKKKTISSLNPSKPTFLVSEFLSLSLMSTDNHTHRPQMDLNAEDQEAIMYQYPSTYYVQSPSTISHANSSTDIRHHTTEYSTCHSPIRSEADFPQSQTSSNPKNQVTRFNLSCYSSYHGSSNSLNEKKMVDYDVGSGKSVENRLIIVDHGGDGDDDDEEQEEEEEDEDEEDEEWYDGKRRGCWWRYFSFRRSSSCVWISLQIFWRLIVSLGVALLVFYIATKPPPPNMSIKMAGIREFVLGEGVDGSGVTTNILTCNCSMELVIDNKSKLFGLHVHPPTMEMSFGRLPFAMSHGPKLYAKSNGSTSSQLYTGTRNKPMYGAGRNMQDMLESGEGLPLVVRMSLSSEFRVVWHLIKPKLHHQAQCLLVLDNTYDKKHKTQIYNSSCTIS
ncbi:hypothetical protein CFOL_v3_10523 [Cephalotus follicularis]|uniref:LEA_2 domain-containing protein n=1 Tax=Cephalotus follicularis TaxID=3775 RepID=A0A1Q3BGK9_CEPFO|nr:hypothetical protein CFOL_v3_10523 [Cephalotus follicularis]